MSDLDSAGLLALVAFVVSVGTGLIVLLPHKLVLEFRGSVLLRAAEQSGVNLSEAYKAAALWIEGVQEQNRDTLARLDRWYTTALVALGVEIVLWTVSVSDNLL